MQLKVSDARPMLSHVATAAEDRSGTTQTQEVAKILLHFARDSRVDAESTSTRNAVTSGPRLSPGPVEIPKVNPKTSARTQRKQRPVNVVFGTAIAFDPSKHHPAACETITQQTQYRRTTITAQVRDGKYIKSEPPHREADRYPVLTITRQEFERKTPSSAARPSTATLPYCFEASTHHPAKTGTCPLRHNVSSNLAVASRLPPKRTAEDPVTDGAAKRQKPAITKAPQPLLAARGADEKRPKQYSVVAGTKVRFDPASHHPALLETLSPRKFSRREPVFFIKGTAVEFDPAKHNPIFLPIERTTRGQFEGWTRTLRLREAGRVERVAIRSEPSPVAPMSVDPAIRHPAFNLPLGPTPRSSGAKPYDVIVFSL